jgi:hypothetical protein
MSQLTPADRPPALRVHGICRGATCSVQDSNVCSLFRVNSGIDLHPSGKAEGRGTKDVLVGHATAPSVVGHWREPAPGRRLGAGARFWETIWEMILQVEP